MANSNRLKKLRKENGMTLDKLSEVTGISRATLNRYENGDSEPKQATWQQLADFFGVTISYIMGLTDQKFKKTYDDMMDLTGKPLFDKEDGKFNTQLAIHEIVECRAKKIPGSNNMDFFYLIKLIDPTTSDICYSVFRAIFYIDSLKLENVEKPIKTSLITNLFQPSMDDSYNAVADIKFATGKFKDITNENFSYTLFNSALAFKKMLDRENKNTEEVDKAILSILEYSKIILNKRYPVFFNDGVTNIFKINYLNETTKVFELN